MRTRHVIAAGVALILLLSVLARGSVNVAASIFPVAAMVEEIGGDMISLTTIVPAGADPHHFEPTPRTAEAIYDADIVFLIGGHLDKWTLGAHMGEDRGAVVVEFHEMFRDSLVPIGDSFNPHFWLDPIFAKTMGKAIAMMLCIVDSVNCSYYESRATGFLAGVDSLHLSVRQRLERTDFDAFVSFHPAWTYFARRYGIDEVGTIEISHDQEASPRHVAEVIRSIENSGVKYILAEEFSNPALAEVIAEQTGARLITLDPIGGKDRQGRDSYFRLIDYNVSRLEEMCEDGKYDR
jgi:zinc transport system substrate-binding protein